MPDLDLRLGTLERRARDLRDGPQPGDGWQALAEDAIDALSISHAIRGKDPWGRPTAPSSSPALDGRCPICPHPEHLGPCRSGEPCGCILQSFPPATSAPLDPRSVESEARRLAGAIHVHGAIPARFWREAISAADALDRRDHEALRREVMSALVLHGATGEQAFEEAGAIAEMFFPRGGADAG